jgi:hypothetical protein
MILIGMLILLLAMTILLGNFVTSIDYKKNNLKIN